jgi:hypothetical protein
VAARLILSSCFFWDSVTITGVGAGMAPTKYRFPAGVNPFMGHYTSTTAEPERDIYGFEGDISHKTHLARERDRSLRDAKLEQFMELHGHLYCEICNFDFENTYGDLGRGIIEIHHTLPVAQMEESHKTRIDDLMCVCANCHLVLHNGDSYINLQKLRFLFDSGKPKRTKRSTQPSPVLRTAAVTAPAYAGSAPAVREGE